MGNKKNALYIECEILFFMREIEYVTTELRRFQNK